MASGLKLGVDLGGTHVRAALVDSEGHSRGVHKAALTSRTPEGVLDAIADVAAKARAGVTEPVLSCGVGIAAQLDGKTGHVLVAPNLGWRDVPFAKQLSQRLALPVRAVNDLSAAAWGELKAGAAKGASEVYVVFVGTGVGSAIISGGQLLEGADGVAGELGHTKLSTQASLDGRACGCGERGCLETLAGGHHLVAMVAEAIEQGASAKLAELKAARGGKLDAGVLEAAAEAGDAVAAAIHRRAGEALGLAIANQVTVLNPSHLVLGGGVLMNLPRLYAQTVQGIQTLAGAMSRRKLTIAKAALGDDSGLLGAALLS